MTTTDKITALVFSYVVAFAGGCLFAFAAAWVFASSAGAQEPQSQATTITLTITRGAAIELRWSAVNAFSCVASGGWSGPVAVSGTITIPTPSIAPYVLQCTGVGGTSSVTVN